MGQKYVSNGLLMGICPVSFIALPSILELKQVFQFLGIFGTETGGSREPSVSA